MKVFITYLNNGYEGKSEPLAAFASEELAKIFQDGALESSGTTVEIKEMEVVGYKQIDIPAEMPIKVPIDEKEEDLFPDGIPF